MLKYQTNGVCYSFGCRSVSYSLGTSRSCELFVWGFAVVIRLKLMCLAACYSFGSGQIVIRLQVSSRDSNGWEQKKVFFKQQLNFRQVFPANFRSPENRFSDFL